MVQVLRAVPRRHENTSSPKREEELTKMSGEEEVITGSEVPGGRENYNRETCVQPGPYHFYPFTAETFFRSQLESVDPQHHRSS